MNGQLAPALVPTVEAPFERELEARNLNDARQLAKWVFESRMFSSYGTPQAILTTVLLGRELGLATMAALRSVHVIEGKHSLSADVMVALVLRSGLAKYFRLVGSDDKAATWETLRVGDPAPTSVTYTVAQAALAGLTKASRSGKPSNWVRQPTQMCRARAKAELARLVYPDLLAGLYTPDELRDFA